MADIFFAAVNARYNHTNLAVRSITAYSAKHWKEAYPDMPAPSCGFGEWTINQPLLEIVRGIAAEKPRIILLPVYIWNVEIVTRLIPELPKVIQNCVVIAGGPEVSYRAEQILRQIEALDAVICGEGEQTCLELAHLYAVQKAAWNPAAFLDVAAKIPGMYPKVRSTDATPDIRFGGVREPLPDLGMLAFPYPEITDPDNRIYYYESSRGCPFRCAYCLSSVERTVRFMPLERVYADLQRFLDARVKLVKFVDRTYNLDDARYIAIWRYIREHHNGYTMFHFEIEAEYLSSAALDYIQNVPAGMMQFEIGVQSTNPETLKAVDRSPDTAKIAANVARIPCTIHTHLDLIAGLPFEDIASFGRSFDGVLRMKPDVLQLGFLKVLSGTKMEKYASDNGWKWMSSAPYEVLSTPYTSYDDLLFLKDVEALLDVLFNSGSFAAFIQYIGRSGSYWQFFSAFAVWCRKQHLFDDAHTELSWFEYVFSFCKQDVRYPVLAELLRYDFLCTGKKGSFPAWYIRRYDKDAHRKALEAQGILPHTGSDAQTSAGTRTAYAQSEYDVFTVDPADPEHSEQGRQYAFLFLYPPRAEKGAGETRIIHL